MVSKTQTIKALDLALIQDLQCYLFPAKPRWCDDRYLTQYNAAYGFWKAMIKEGLVSEGLELQAAGLTSDEFIRQDEFACLFQGEIPVGLFMFSWLDTSNPVVLDHSYFSSYPPAAIAALRDNDHRLIMSMGQLTVHADWRKGKVGPGISELLVGFATKRFMESSASALITFTRNNRKTNELGYRYGGVPLHQGAISHGIASDALAVYRNTVTPSCIKHAPEAVDCLWSQKINTIQTRGRNYENGI